MLQVTYELGADEKSTEELAKEHVLAAIKSGDPIRYAAMVGAGAACTSVVGPWSATLCSWAAGWLWDQLFGPGCAERGGTVWCLQRCAEKYPVELIRDDCRGPDCLTLQQKWKSSCCKTQVVLDPPLPIDQYRSQYGAKSCTCEPRLQPSESDCCTNRYCQLPGMPAPVAPDTRPLSERLSALRPSILETTTQTLTTEYPSGSVAARDPKTNLWRVAVLRSELAGESAYVEVAQLAQKPAGVAELPFTDYLRRTGQLPWYKDWRVWAITGTVAAAGTGGYLLWKRRKRRKAR